MSDYCNYYRFNLFSKNKLLICPEPEQEGSTNIYFTYENYLLFTSVYKKSSLNATILFISY